MTLQQLEVIGNERKLRASNPKDRRQANET